MSKKLVLGALALSAATLIAGCFGHAGGYAEVDAPVVFTEEPTLVEVEPDVWVARDSDYAVYYVDDYYWVYRDDVWHRSRTYDGGWASVEVSIVPRLIVSRDQRTYVHYRGAPNAPTRKAPREGGNERERLGRADERREAPQGRPGDKGPRTPERAEDRHDAAPARDVDKEHASDRHDVPPRQDEHPGADPHHDKAGNKDNGKREDHEQKEEKKGDDRGRQGKDEQKGGEKRDDHDKR